jgi:hypothetical protein
LAAATNYEQPLATPTRTKGLERKSDKAMSLPDEDVGQVSALKCDSATDAIAPNGPRHCAAAHSQLPRARRVGGEVTEPGVNIKNQSFDITSV